DPETQKYKYNGKEFDRYHGLDMYDYGARFYDPSICRFTTMDPMCEKYYHLSPYIYCGNNPINAIDVNGDSIFYYMPIIEKGEIKEYIKYEYGKYGDSYGFGAEGKLYQGNNQTIAYMNNALNRIRNGGEVGRNLVDYLSGHTGLNVAIKYGDNETSFNLNNMNHNIEVSWNPLDTDGGLDVNGNYERPTYIGLAHELAHAYDMISNGSIDETIWIPAHDTYKAVGVFEKTASIIENRIRMENSLPQRAYYLSIRGKGYAPSSLPIFYPNLKRR
ncbi:MAG: hypothetical protein II838_13355, partial [Lachnospiraceae bacterium]|nr:hypothetical protein [Lachnospiraceae bacterium]